MAASTDEDIAAASLRTSSAELAVAAEQTWADAGERLRGVNISEKYLELKERELQNVIAQNYARIQGVEKELQGLQLQLKLTSGPKRSALEMLRRKIEAQTDRVITARMDAQAAQQVADAAAERLAAEERAKDLLCQELNLLVQQSAHAQLEKLESLTKRLEALNAPVRGPEAAAQLQQRIAEVAAGEAAAANAADTVVAAAVPPAAGSHSAAASAQGDATSAAGSDGGQASTANSAQGGSQSPPAVVDAAAAARTWQQAAAARGRHVGMGAPRRTGSPERGAARAARPSAAAAQAAAAAQPAQRGAFQGFDT